MMRITVTWILVIEDDITRNSDFCLFLLYAYIYDLCLYKLFFFFFSCVHDYTLVRANWSYTQLMFAQPFFFLCLCVRNLCLYNVYNDTCAYKWIIYIYVCVCARVSACRFVDRLDCMQDYKHKTPFGQCITSTLIDVKSSSNPTLQFCLYFVNWKVENITKRCINYH